MFTVQNRAPSVNFERCAGCDLCASLCPHSCLELVKGRAVLLRPNDCRGEGLCVAICPEGAIQMISVPAVAKRAQRVRV
jgi:pyruvate ferredoxin oxidoreductase delta subunit